ncbi:MAG: hypothetical protein FJ279_33945, partial [Planctomycetes bacterium]|nr:hypothetical protein [Planctomycetota bacterium]
MKMLVRSIALLSFCSVCGQAAEPPTMGPPRRADGIPLQTCRIVTPEAAAVRQAVEDLARRLRERGATVSVASSVQKSGFSEKPDFSAGETLILVGNLVTNRALLPLYASVLDFTDAYYPGGDGYVVRTVLDAPGRGTDCLVLGGSTDEGTVKAVRRACEILAGLKPGQPFPRTLEVKLGGKTVNSLQWAWNASPTGDATSAGYLYGLCGQPKLAEIAKREFLKPDVEGGQRFYNISDYALEPRLRAWALVCDSPVFSQEEVQTVHQLLLNTLVFDQNMYWRARGGDRIGSRHQTMGTSAFLSVVNHLLRRGNPNEAALALLNRWKKECDAYFANAVT